MIKNDSESKINNEEENFSALLENSLNRNDNYYPGDRVQGIIVQINDDSALVDISGKSEAIIDINEFLDGNNNITIKIDDKIDAYIVSTTNGEIKLTSSIGKGFINDDILTLAYEQKIPLKGTIVNKVKGGYSVKISNFTCFCPFSQIDNKKIENESLYLNKTYTFEIIEYSNRNIIVSRRRLLDKILKEKETKLKETLEIGSVVNGTVTKSLDFGIFVDIGGIDGLVPRSELSLSRLVNPADFVSGSSVQAKVIDIDWDKKKISLSIRQTMDDPWDNIDEYQIGENYSAIITNIIPKGAFAQIIPGIEGFIPVSKMSYIKKINKPDDILAREQEVNVKIVEIDKKDKKILLELNSEDNDPWQDENLNDINDNIYTAIIESKNNYGLNIRLENGLSGFIPVKELINNSINDYNESDEIKICTLQVEKEKRKLIASEKAAEKLLEKSEYLKHMKLNDENNTSNLGSMFQNVFADLKKNIK